MSKSDVVKTIADEDVEYVDVRFTDPRGKLHLIGDVEPEKMEGVNLGDTVVVIYREALALSLEHKAKAAE